MWNKKKIEKHPQKQLSLPVLFFLPLFLKAKYRRATATSSRPQHWPSERRQEEVHSRPLTAFISACLGSVKKTTLSTKKKKKKYFSYHKESYIGKMETLRQKSYKNKYRPIIFPTFYLQNHPHYGDIDPQARGRNFMANESSLSEGTLQGTAVF